MLTFKNTAILLLAITLASCGSSTGTDGKTDNPFADSERQAVWVAKGMEAIRAKLKDADSAQFRNVSFYSGGGIPTVCGEVNAKNSFGGYAGYERFLAAGDALAYTESQVQGGLGPAWKKYCVKAPHDPQ